MYNCYSNLLLSLLHFSLCCIFSRLWNSWQLDSQLGNFVLTHGAEDIVDMLTSLRGVQGRLPSWLIFAIKILAEHHEVCMCFIVSNNLCTVKASSYYMTETPTLSLLCVYTQVTLITEQKPKDQMLNRFICSLSSLNMFLMLVIIQNWRLKHVGHIRTSGNKTPINITSVKEVSGGYYSCVPGPALCRWDCLRGERVYPTLCRETGQTSPKSSKHFCKEAVSWQTDQTHED